MIVGRIVAGVGNGNEDHDFHHSTFSADTFDCAGMNTGLCIELAINIFGVMTAYWVGQYQRLYLR